MQNNDQPIPYVNSFWDKAKFWFTMRKIRNQKIRIVWEILMDKHFYESHYGDEIAYIDKDDREALAAENRKPRGEQDIMKIASLEEKIARAKSVKELYRKNDLLRQEHLGYIELLDAWLKNN